MLRLPLCAIVILCGYTILVRGHGHMFFPAARNQPNNGAVGGGPGAVHSFTSGVHAKYQHGICGNPAGAPQSYNRVGDVQATFTAGTVADVKVLITAHHVGYFELELCTDAGHLSEACFMQHRLLRHGCDCACPSDPTNSCAACEKCRRWWKPLVEGETSQVVTAGYQGPVLPGQGNVVPYEFTLRYGIPAGIRTNRGVLRWHYMTTNSCTSRSSSPEEFWNCADVAIADASGETGDVISFDNEKLEAMDVENLMPDITAQPPVLIGVQAACPEDAAGQLVGVGAREEYEGLCGAVDGTNAFENCRDTSGGMESSEICNGPLPASGYLCKEECSVWWYDCANGFAYKKRVPAGTKCQGNDLVLESVCLATSVTSTDTTTRVDVTSSTFVTTLPNTAICSQPAAPTVLVCEAQCGDRWYDCAHGVAMLMPVPAGTKCKDNSLVLDSECADFSGTASITTTITAPMTTVSASTSTAAGDQAAIQSGDTVFLTTHSGWGKIVDIEDAAVQARWGDRGNWQAITIGKPAGGSIASGDTVFLAAHTGALIDVQGEAVRARWDERGAWQALTVEKPGGGAVLPGDVVCLRAHTGKHIDIDGGVARARWDDCGLWQQLRIEREDPEAIFSGQLVHLRAHTGKHVDVEDEQVRARWADRGAWQALQLSSAGGRAIWSGDAVFLTAHTGMQVDVEGTAVQARYQERGAWQQFTIEKHGGGIIRPGDVAFLRTHLSTFIDVEGTAVGARWYERGDWQALVIERRVARRLRQTERALTVDRAAGETGPNVAIGVVVGIGLAFTTGAAAALFHRHKSRTRAAPFGQDVPAHRLRDHDQVGERGL